MLNSKLNMPPIGLGTWKLQGQNCEEAVALALELGYRHIDTADVYENHEAVGKGIRQFPRHQLYLTTKVAFHNLLPAQVHESVPRFLKELQTDYIDLLLIHWPNPEFNMVDTLKAMQHYQQQGVVRHIGVSNFVRTHLEPLSPYHFPLVTNQIELHPYFQRPLLIKACQQYGIGLTAYRPLADGALEKEPVLIQIGKTYGKTASQVALRWLIQQGISAIPKAGNPQHLKDNLDVLDFTLSDADNQAIAALDRSQRTCIPENMFLSPD